MNGYIAQNAWAKFVRQNGRKVKAAHTALMWACHQIANEAEWAEEFQLPTKEAMDLAPIRDKETFYQTLKDLVDFGAIKIIEDSVNRYTARWVTLHNLEFYMSEIPIAIPTTIPTATPVATTTAEPLATPIGTLPNNKLIKTNKTIQTDKPQKEILNISFEEFYDAYGKKVDKVDAKKRWARLTDQERELAMDDIPKYRATITNPQFQKSPATYLNKQSWTDEREPSKQVVKVDQTPVARKYLNDL
jgi:hypothetical protein